ncbi:MAG: hypothetical protein K2O05_03180 [Anaeroplasmataceae bacterium]|nr:hypothetical protein [Anaeroplasmataceae bacterium]
MQNTKDDEHILEDTRYLFERCIRADEYYDYEFSDEFFVLSPVDINDMYNLNNRIYFIIYNRNI